MFRHCVPVLCLVAIVFCIPGVARGRAYAFIDLGVTGDTTARAYAVNSSNQVTGSFNAGSGYRAFSWTVSPEPRFPR